MESFEIDLRFSFGHKISDSDLDIFSIVSFEVIHLVMSNLSVEVDEDGHHQIGLTLQEPIDWAEDNKGSWSHRISIVRKIRSSSNKSHHKVESPEKQKISSGSTEILIVSRHLFSTDNIKHTLKISKNWKVRSVVKIIEWVSVYFLSWSLYCFRCFLMLGCLLLKCLKMSRVFFLEFGIGLGRNRVGREPEEISWNRWNHSIITNIIIQSNPILPLKKYISFK